MGYEQRDRARRGFGGWRRLLADRVAAQRPRPVRRGANGRAGLRARGRRILRTGLVELVEAGVRGGRPDESVAALDRLSERTRASGTEWALGIEARCRAPAERRRGAL